MKSKSKAKEITIYQQGDVILKKVAAVPSGFQPAPHKVLQFGVATGHKHEFVKDVTVYTDCAPEEDSRLLDTRRNRKFVAVDCAAVLYHTNDHLPQVIAPGIYEVDIVRRYDYVNNAIRRVED